MNKFKLINLTPHDLQIYNPDNGETFVLPKSGQVARIEDEFVLSMAIKTEDDETILLYKASYGDIIGLPDYDKQGNLLYVVSTMVFDQAKHYRDDVLCPGELIRNDEGRVTGCKGLRHW